MAAAPQGAVKLVWPPGPEAMPPDLAPAEYAHVLTRDEQTDLDGNPGTPANEPPLPAHLFPPPPPSRRSPATQAGPPSQRRERTLKESLGLIAPTSPPPTRLGSQLPAVTPDLGLPADEQQITAARTCTPPKPQSPPGSQLPAVAPDLGLPADEQQITAARTCMRPKPQSPPGSQLPVVAPDSGLPADEQQITAARTCTRPKPQSPPQPPPRFLVERDGDRYCLLCSQWADDAHLRSKKHTKRAWAPEYYLWDEIWPDGIDESMPATQDSAFNKPALPPLPVRTEAPLLAVEPHRDLISCPGETAWGLAKGKPISSGVTPNVVALALPENRRLAKRACSWCSSPAIERPIPGTKARYCADCWSWWALNGDAVGGARPAPVPPPPPKDPPQFAGWGQHVVPVLPVAAPAWERTGLQRDPRPASIANRSLMPPSYYTNEILV